MPWSKDKTVPALKDKSDEDKALFARVADTAIELQALSSTAFSPAAPSVLIHITQVNQ